MDHQDRESLQKVIQDTANLQRALEILAKELFSSKKDGPASFFLQVKNQLASSTNESEVAKLAKQLSTSAAMSQYAGFSNKEDRLFDKVFDEANKILPPE
jgi:Tfp pilus assembly protein PilF